MERLHKFTRDTIGSRPCERGLGEILEKLANPVVTRAAMSRYNAFKEELRLFTPLFQAGNKKFVLNLLNLWRLNFYKEWENRYKLDGPHPIPKDVYTFLVCCFNAEYKDFLRKIENELS